MIGQYKHFIDENIAPKNVETISIYDSNNVKKASMLVPEFMKYPSETPLYKFGVISDLHIVENGGSGFDFALSHFKSIGCPFVCSCGDNTNVGFYNSSGEKNLVHYARYKEIKDSYVDDNFNVYTITGNHDSYYKAITEDLELYTQYTGCELYYSVLHGNDVFMFIGQPASNKLLNSEQLAWLQTQLENYANNRCFLFVHPYITNDSGNPFACYGNDIFSWTTERNDFINAIKNHGNVVLFHGHSHFKFQCQEDDKANNYTKKNGFHSVHVPSCQSSAIVEYDENGNPSRLATDGVSQGYIVEVFSNCIVLNGIDFSLVNGTRNVKLIPQGIIKIDTI